LGIDRLLEVLNGLLYGVKLLHHLEGFFTYTQGGLHFRAQEGKNHHSQ